MTTSELITLLGLIISVVVGSGGLLTFFATRNQNAAREAAANARAKRQLEDYANELRSQLTSAGITPKEWPDYE